MRSRSSTQQISGINKPSKLSASYKLQKGEDAVPRFVDASNKLVDAVETSQRLSDKIGETQAISSNEGVLKPVISSNIAAPRVTQSRSGSPKESAVVPAEPVVENGPTDVLAVVQPVNSGFKLAPTTICTEAEVLASKQSSDCCMIVKPKQLNFDEIEECDLDETCSPLSKKRKMDGLPGQECFPSDVSVSSVDHKSVSLFFERRLSDANALSSSPKAADTLSDNNFDERMNDETTNLGLEIDENLVGVDVEDNSKISPHNIIDATCEVSASPKEVTTVVDEDNRPGISHSKEDHASSLKMQIEDAVEGKRAWGHAQVLEQRILSIPIDVLTKYTQNVTEDHASSLKMQIEECGEITIRELRKKLEKVQREKDEIQFNVEKFENASKSLNKLIECQIVDNCKKGFGYENYNAVPPPYTGKFMPLTPDLSFTSLDEFVNKPVVESCKAKSSEVEPKADPKVVRKNNVAPIIEE
ncbi:hypothetical protein Tco_0463162 [Tanacetum coccineum]